MRYFAQALQSDVSDIQEGTTAEGIHLGAMAGTADLVQRVSSGIEVTGDMLRLNPRLPEELERLDMRIRYRGHTLDLKLTRETLTIRCREPGVASIRPRRERPSARARRRRCACISVGRERLNAPKAISRATP